MIFLPSFYLTILLAHLIFQSGADPGFPTEELWWKDVCRGEKLDAAMRWSEPQASSFLEPVNSPWDGTLYKELREWGYTESQSSEHCDFDKTWNMYLVFNGLGIDPKSTARGGPNQCFMIQHGTFSSRTPIESQRYTVNGKEYQVTSAMTIIGVNRFDGMLYFINVKSPAKAAERLWGRKPSSDELPALRAQSDYAWGFWLRMHYSGGVSQINGIWSTKVVNKETLQILNLAFKTYRPEPGKPKSDGPQIWPGTDFSIATVEGQAILGSPNGLAPGYFLAQHKRQFGGNKFIYKVTVFKDYHNSEVPSLIFWVKDAKPLKRESGAGKDTSNLTAMAGEYGGSKVLEQSKDKKNILREHILEVKFKSRDDGR